MLGRLLTKASRNVDFDEEDSAFVTPIIVLDARNTYRWGLGKRLGVGLSQFLGGWYEKEPSITTLNRPD